MDEEIEIYSLPLPGEETQWKKVKNKLIDYSFSIFLLLCIIGVVIYFVFIR